MKSLLTAVLVACFSFSAAANDVASELPTLVAETNTSEAKQVKTTSSKAKSKKVKKASKKKSQIKSARKNKVSAAAQVTNESLGVPTVIGKSPKGNVVIKILD